MKKIWVLTREINEYYQDGEYFMTAFTNEPIIHQLNEQGLTDEEAEYVLHYGGGRMGLEYQWYYLNEISLK